MTRKCYSNFFLSNDEFLSHPDSGLATTDAVVYAYRGLRKVTHQRQKALYRIIAYPTFMAYGVSSMPVAITSSFPFEGAAVPLSVR